MTASLVTALVLCGIGWGLTTPLSKLAVSAAHAHLTLLVWNLAQSLAILLAIAALRRRLPPLTPPALVAWSALLLGETYPAGFWAALALMLGGLFLVGPRAEPLR